MEQERQYPQWVRVDWTDIDSSPRPALVPDLMPQGRLVCLSAAGEAGKSWVMLQMAVATALGDTSLWCHPDAWLDRDGANSKVCAYIDYEDDAPNIKRRLEWIMSSMSIPQDMWEPVLKRIAYCNPTQAIWRHQAPHTGWSSMLEYVQAHNPSLIMLDTRSAAFAGNENDRAEVTDFLMLLSSLTQTGCTVILANHFSKYDKNISGSTAWINVPRVSLAIERVKRDVSVIYPSKANDIAEPRPILLNHPRGFREQVEWSWDAYNDVIARKGPSRLALQDTMAWGVLCKEEGYE